MTQPLGVAGTAAGVMLVVAVFLGIKSCGSSPAKVDAKAEAAAVERKAESDRSSKRKNLALDTKTAIRQGLRDPESLKFYSMRVDDYATLLCAEYGARNGFGGMNRATLVIRDGNASDDAAQWRASCSSASHMHDLAGLVN